MIVFFSFWLSAALGQEPQFPSITATGCAEIAGSEEASRQNALRKLEADLQLQCAAHDFLRWKILAHGWFETPYQKTDGGTYYPTKCITAFAKCSL